MISCLFGSEIVGTAAHGATENHCLLPLFPRNKTVKALVVEQGLKPHPQHWVGSELFR